MYVVTYIGENYVASYLAMSWILLIQWQLAIVLAAKYSCSKLHSYNISEHDDSYV